MNISRADSYQYLVNEKNTKDYSKQIAVATAVLPYSSYSQNVKFQAVSDSFEYSENTHSSEKTDMLKDEFDRIQNEQGFIGKAWNGIKSIFGGGSKKVEKTLDKYQKGEISFEEASQVLEKYEAGQKMSVDVAADLLSGIIAFGAFALAVPTGGTSLAAGLALSAAAGAGIKIGVKAGDAAAGKREYSGKDLLYDTATGAVNGLLAPVTNGIGASVTKTVGTKLGLTIAKEGAEEIVEQGIKSSLKSIIMAQTVDVIGGNTAKRALALGAGMAVDGALGGASDNMVRAALNGEDVTKAGIQGAVGGLIMAPIIGGGFRAAGKIGHSINNKITTNHILPDGVNTAFKQGETGDCAFLSILDGLMNSKEAQNKIKKSITKSLGGDYNVTIGNRTVKVAKDALTDEMLSDTTGIKIFEQAYKQIAGDLDGGFAEVAAKQFGLNPVHITSDAIVDETLNKLAKEKSNVILSFGTKIDADGNISSKGSNHYFTIKDIDTAAKKVTVSDPYDTSKLIDLSYEDIKKFGISIDGGSIKETSLPNTARQADDILFKGVDVSDIKTSLVKYFDETGISETDLEKVLSGIKYGNGTGHTLDDIASEMKLYNLSKEDVLNCLSYILDGDSLAEYMDAGMGTEVIARLTKALDTYSLVQNNSLFDSFKLSLEDSLQIYESIQNSYAVDAQKICEILRKNNPSVFETLGGESYVTKNLYNIQQAASNIPSAKVINPENLIELETTVNGRKKYIIFPEATTVLNSNANVDVQTLIKSNMITTDLVSLAQDCSAQFPKTLKSKVKDAAGNTIELTYKTDVIVNKLQKNGIEGLTSHEIHGLTDALSNLYESNPSFAKKVAQSMKQGSALGTKSKKIYNYVEYLKQKASNVLQKNHGDVVIADHAYMRMLDRNLVSAVDNGTGNIIGFTELIDKLATAAKKAADSGKSEAILKGFEGSDGIKMIIKQQNGKIIIDSVM